MKFLAGIMFLFTTSAFAQQQQAPTPEMQAVQAELMQQLNAKLQCVAGVVALQAEIKALKDKYEPVK